MWPAAWAQNSKPAALTLWGGAYRTPLRAALRYTTVHFGRCARVWFRNDPRSLLLQYDAQKVQAAENQLLKLCFSPQRTSISHSQLVELEETRR
jgi:hypothetical protein